MRGVTYQVQIALVLLVAGHLLRFQKCENSNFGAIDVFLFFPSHLSQLAVFNRSDIIDQVKEFSIANELRKKKQKRTTK
jgi:hypothetical protein